MEEQKLYHLLEKMTLEEKVNQLVQIPASAFEKSGVDTGDVEERKYTQRQISQAGSIIGMVGAENVRRIQKHHMENHPHHIPMLFMMDVIHGFRTIFPIPLGQGASFHPELVERCAKAAAREASSSGVHVTFAPMSDLVRDARWGRVMEATGEDPYLNSIMTRAMIRGFQGGCDIDYQHVAACTKHFAAYGAPQGGRDYNNVELSEHSLREYYLPAYKAGIQEGCKLMMTSFNSLNGVPATANPWLMKKILREEFEFEGVLISDWRAIEELITHGIAENERDAAYLAIESGVDIDMASHCYADHLEELVTSGILEERVIDEAVFRVLKLKNVLGLFENPYRGADPSEESRIFLNNNQRALSREAARESFVLLKNDILEKKLPILPLSGCRKTVFLGPYVESQKLHSSWALMGREKDAVSISQALYEKKKGEELHFHIIKNMNENSVQEIREADAVVLCIGEDRMQSGEAASRGDICVPEQQLSLLRRLYEINSNIISVVFSGRPLDLREVSEKSKAVLAVWLPGTEGGNALLDVLYGNYNPSGKLPMSFPYCTGQIPVFYNHYSTGRPCLKENTPYRSCYLDIPNAPLYPFGYGLSYTKFLLSPTTLSHAVMKGEKDIITASVIVKNEGHVTGTEIVQMYIRDRKGKTIRPVKELKGFQRVQLAPGEEQIVEFAITEEMLRYHSPDGVMRSENGKFTVWIDNSSDTRGEGVEFCLEK